MINKELNISTNYLKFELYIVFIISLFFSVALYIPVQEYLEKFTDKYSIYIAVILACIIPNTIFSLLAVAYIKIRKFCIFRFLFLKLFIHNFLILLSTMFFGMLFLVLAAFSTDNPDQTKEGAFLVFLIPTLIVFFIFIFVITRPFVNHLDKLTREMKVKEEINKD